MLRELVNKQQRSGLVAAFEVCGVAILHGDEFVNVEHVAGRVWCRLTAMCNGPGKVLIDRGALF